MFFFSDHHHWGQQSTLFSHLSDLAMKDGYPPPWRMTKRRCDELKRKKHWHNELKRAFAFSFCTSFVFSWFGFRKKNSHTTKASSEADLMKNEVGDGEKCNDNFFLFYLFCLRFFLYLGQPRRSQREKGGEWCCHCHHCRCYCQRE